MELAQSNLIAPTVNGFAGFWINGVIAARAHMTYATYAVDAGLPLDGYIHVAKEQHAFIHYLTTEYNVINNRRFSYPDAEQSVLRRLNHDYINRLFNYLHLYLACCDQDPKHKTFMHRSSRVNFHLKQPLSEFVRGISSFVHARYLDRAVEPYFSFPQDLLFRNDETAEHARTVIENLIENAIKYNVHNGRYEVVNEGSKIIVNDKGIGMDPAFAARLGQGQRIREGRAEDVEGTGVGLESIAEHCARMGWRWEIETKLGEGTKVTIFMNNEDFVEIDRSRPLEIRPDFQPLPLAEIVHGAERYADLIPFAGYLLGAGPDGNQIDVTQSPIFEAIKHARVLMNHLTLGERF